MTNNEQNRKALKAALKSTSKKTNSGSRTRNIRAKQVSVHDEAKIVEGRPICNIHKAS